jgi:hypothetical protein
MEIDKNTFFIKLILIYYFFIKLTSEMYYNYDLLLFLLYARKI